jgi:hypothetical protein
MYRIVKWWPEQPTQRQPATEETFTDLALAEQTKTDLEEALPHRRFAVEHVEERPA